MWFFSPSVFIFEQVGIYSYVEFIRGRHRILDRENPVDRGAWQATAHGVAKSQT